MNLLLFLGVEVVDKWKIKFSVLIWINDDFLYIGIFYYDVEMKFLDLMEKMVLFKIEYFFE